ncbi:MerR family transcriptional regulator [Phormidium sp. CLA17]|uniref:MerR family transcriptional regulator n=1 Tax=Leptolyngbya sp. Cla-17 TaxID=2803751 RepID=UPI001491381C|nr:MerR family transcriptional regulator [Leptolyngbya sp. Cla-17]MBM0743767.1 MerR family transcriptional regulator [Leptolyngbya sp. Cla-17]
MKSLQQLAQASPNWSLDELVQVANELLPQFLPEERVQSRIREEVTPRLVRHYTSLEMLDEPLKEGREARYTYRHLLQVLLVRKLLTEGYGSSAIGQFAKAKTNSELENLLQGGVQLTITPANPALAYLQQIQQRTGDRSISAENKLIGNAPASPTPVSLPTSSLPTPSQWFRIEILPGLELHVRNDFVSPSSSQEQQTLLQLILSALLTHTRKRRSSS